MKIRVVVADDSSIQRDVLRSYLYQIPNVEVEIIAACETGKQAWDAIVEHQPDVAILDCMMDPPTGIEIVRKGREQKLPVYFLLCSSMGQKKVASDANVDIIIKPISLPVLELALSKYFAEKSVSSPS